jgi:sarcosine oxidase
VNPRIYQQSHRAKNVADIIVIGLGAVGSAVAHHAAKAGATVIGMDRFHPPHRHGSSHGATRITRLAIGEGHELVPVVQRSHALWRTLEAETGDALMHTTGGLIIASPSSDGRPYHGNTGFFEQTVRAAERLGIHHELLSADEIRHRFPAFTPVDGDRGYWERDAGILDPERCVAAQLKAAASRGADLRYDTTVHRIESAPDGSGAIVVTDSDTFHAAQVVLATGAWLPSMIPPEHRGRFAVQRQVLHWFHTDTPALYARDRCPVFIWMHGESGSAFYGFPMGDGYDGVKTATEQMEHATTPDAVDRVVSPEETTRTYRDHISGRLRGISAHTVHDATCLYTSTPDGRFVIDRHPRWPSVTIVSACSGHGFKHSAAIGEAVAQSVLGIEAVIDLSPFATLCV